MHSKLDMIDIHLFKSPELNQPIAKFQGNGNNRVEKLIYNKDKNQLHINKNQYFKPVNEEVYQYQIGGYQVCKKWLKDRKGSVLTLDDIKHYCKVITALQRTIKIQKEIDNIYKKEIL